MADQREAGISWTDETWNPVVGCSIVSPACTNCYAMAIAARIERMAGGTGKQTHYAGTTRTVNGKPVWTGKLQLAPDQILTAPLRWKRPRRVFVNSMSDLFHEDMPEAWIDRVFAVMALSPQHTFQILTKRPDRMRAYLIGDLRASNDEPHQPHQRIAEAAGQMIEAEHHASPASRRLRDLCEMDEPFIPLPNVWLGVTAEDQRRADERIPDLLATPAAVRFVSAEPLLGAVDLSNFMWPVHRWHDATFPSFDAAKAAGAPCGQKRQALVGAWCTFLDWVIVGGESGPGARPTHPDWIRSIRDQCASSGVAFHFKQWGEWAPGECSDGPPTRTEQAATWWDDRWRTESITIRHSEEMHRDDEPDAYRLGKRRAGRMLDGRIHDAFPEPRR